MAPPESPTPRRRARTAIMLLAPVALFVALVVIDVPACPSRTLFGIPCPGCGLTRATFAAITGRWADALRYHPLVFLVVPWIGLLAVRSARADLGAPPHPWLERAARQEVTAVVGMLLLATFAVRAAGLVGALPDPVAPERGLVARVLHGLSHVVRPEGPARAD